MKQIFFSLYIHPKCSTCKDALRFLEAKHMQIQPIDITQHPPTLKELQQMLDYQNRNIKKLLNTSGQLYREMNLSQKLPSLSETEILELLHKHGMLIKRPFLLGPNFGLTGFNETTWNTHFETGSKRP